MKKLLASILIFLTIPYSALAVRVVTIGYEWQAATTGVELSNDYGTIIDTTTKYGGAASGEFSGSLATTAAFGADHSLVQTCAECYFRWNIYVDELKNTNDVSVYISLFSGATNVIGMEILNNGGTYTAEVYYNNYGTSLGTFSITPDQWNRLEVFYNTTPADGSEVLTVRQNGSTELTSSAVTFTTKTVNLLSQGLYNGSAGTYADGIVYFDDIAVNDAQGDGQNSWAGDGKVVILVPTGAGSSNCTTGDWSMVNEIPPSNTATSGATMCELDTTTSTAYFDMTDSSTAGIDSYDTISWVTPRVRVREEAAGTSNYGMAIASASGGTATTSALTDAGNATARTNPVSTTAFSLQRFGTSTDPTTNVAWTPTGTNSIDNMQIGVLTTDGTPDTWVLTVAALVEYVDGTPPPTGGSGVDDFWDD